MPLITFWYLRKAVTSETLRMMAPEIEWVKQSILFTEPKLSTERKYEQGVQGSLHDYTQTYSSWR